MASLANFEAGEIAPTGDHILVLADYFKCDYTKLISSDAQTSLARTETLFRRFGNEFKKPIDSLTELTLKIQMSLTDLI